ncbi:hypothetical protein ACIBO5_11165 [Nonomuraea angiospora]|uniref:hypothetical protein n=1 Tax=Nonomuraea angiospora TaxID=46172 RepID=UPI0029AEDB8A|nr:hypothetical protein [Nonomuraea angiospora]MDX3108176.1 hypothetical protein [Nonomuraea angiospora]
MAGKRWLVAVVLPALGPVLAAAYAGVNRVAVEAAVKAQITGPEWAGGRLAADGMTALGRQSWWLILATAVVVGVLGVVYVVIGVLLRRGGRGRTPLLVLSGVLIVPYALAVLVALLNPARALAGLYDTPDFADGLPGWQPATVLILVAAGLAQAVGVAMAAAHGRRAAESRT